MNFVIQVHRAWLGIDRFPTVENQRGHTVVGEQCRRGDTGRSRADDDNGYGLRYRVRHFGPRLGSADDRLAVGYESVEAGLHGGLDSGCEVLGGFPGMWRHRGQDGGHELGRQCDVGEHAGNADVIPMEW